MEQERARQKAAVKKNSVAVRTMRHGYLECIKECGENMVCADECKVTFHDVV